MERILVMEFAIHQFDNLAFKAQVHTVEFYYLSLIPYRLQVYYSKTYHPNIYSSLKFTQIPYQRMRTPLRDGPIKCDING